MKPAIKKKIAMVVFSTYPEDPRVRREAEALVSAGASVSVICISKEGAPGRDVVSGVSVFRLPVLRKRGNVVRYLWEYMAFSLLSWIVLTGLHIREKFDFVHVHNMPDFLVFVATLPRLLGAKIILDLHDPTPEVFQTKYSLSPGHGVIKLLCYLERMSIRFSHIVLTPNTAFKELFVSRGCPAQKIHIIMNSPDPLVFASNGGHSRKEGNDFLLMFHGTIVERHGLDTALDALLQLKKEMSGIQFHVFGEGDFTDEFLALCDRKNLKEIVRYHGHIPNSEIPSWIDRVDLGIIPNKAGVFTELNFPTRIFEYLACHKPVVAPRTKGILDYFDDESLFLFDPGDPRSLAQTILRAAEDASLRLEIVNRGRVILEKNSWEEQKLSLHRLYALDHSRS